MDLRLPDMDGTDAARALAGEERTARIPIVALSALRLERDDDWFLAAGFAGFLEKPISVGEFPDQVRSYCARADVIVPDAPWCASTPRTRRRAGL